MSEEPKVHLTEEQWEYIKRHENERTKEMNRHNAQIQLSLAEALHLVAKSQSVEDKRDYFAGQALAGLLANEQMTSLFTITEMVRPAYGAADAMIEERKGGSK